MAGVGLKLIFRRNVLSLILSGSLFKSFAAEFAFLRIEKSEFSLVRKLKRLVDIPLCFSLKRPLCHTLSKALDISRNTPLTYIFLK